MNGLKLCPSKKRVDMFRALLETGFSICDSMMSRETSELKLGREP
jgi:hypothetical protein